MQTGGKIPSLDVGRSCGPWDGFPATEVFLPEGFLRRRLSTRKKSAEAIVSAEVDVCDEGPKF